MIRLNNKQSLCIAPLSLKLILLIFCRVEDYPAIHKLFPKAEIKFIPDSGHWLHSEKPLEFVQTVTEFLDECLQHHDEPLEEDEN